MAGRETIIEATKAQRQLVALAEISEEGQLAYNEQFAIELIGTLNLELLENAIQTMIHRRDSHGIAFRQSGRQQIIRQPSKAAIEYSSIIGLDENTPVNKDKQRVAIERWIEQRLLIKFDLFSGPLYKFSVGKVDDNHHVLLMTYHHAIADGWAIQLCLEDIAELYTAEIENRNPNLKDAVSFTEYTSWLSGYLASTEVSKHRKYWIDLYKSPPDSLLLPTKANRSLTRSFKGNTIRRIIDRDLVDKLVALGKANDCTAACTLYASYTAMLHRVSSQEDFVVAIPSLGREFGRSINIAGYCTSLLPIRNRVSSDRRFIDHLEATQNEFLDAIDNRAYPFSSIIDELTERKIVDGDSFISAVFNYDDYIEVPEFSRLDCRSYPLKKNYIPYNLFFNIIRHQDEYHFEFHYRSDVLDSDGINRFCENYIVLLRNVIENPRIKIGDYEALSEKEKRTVLIEFNSTNSEYPDKECIHTVFERQVISSPDSIAVIYGNEFITYSELNRKSNQLARYLIDQHGVIPNSLIGICVDRSIEMVIGLLGILKSGSAYVPIDPDYPQAQLEHMLQDSGVKLLITQKHLDDRLQFADQKKLFLDCPSVFDQFGENDLAGLTDDLQSGSLAYVIYTSGSTGKPKGVAVRHQGVTRLVCKTNYIDLNRNSVVVQHSTISFDAATFEIWAPLLNGGKLAVFPGRSAELGKLGRYVEQVSANVMFVSAAIFSQWVKTHKHSNLGIRYLFTGGDVVLPSAVRELYDNDRETTVINAYGPTENTTYSTVYAVPRTVDKDVSLPIGKPIAQSTCYVLNGNGQLCGVGCIGELYVGGDGVAKGYINRPELTAEKFVTNPYFKAGGVIYRTGDLVRWLPDGNLEFLGRADHQVKIRGFRIELGEIEVHLVSSELVAEGLVLAREDTPGNKRLVAYVVPSNDVQGLGDNEYMSKLRDHLKNYLPAHMIPAAFVLMDELPLTKNGKVDRKSLPVPDDSALIRRESRVPSNETEQVLVAIWKEILEVGEVSTLDNFFEVGGTSLKLMELNALINERLNTDISVPDLFTYPTILSLSNFIKGGVDGSLSDRSDILGKGRESLHRLRNRRQGTKA